MLKGCVKPLITLVLALAATGLLSTLCPARELRSPQGFSAARTMEGAKPRPIVTSGEPDQPLSPPPPRLNSGITPPLMTDVSSGGDYWVVLRWTGWIWAYWFARAQL